MPYFLMLHFCVALADDLFVEGPSRLGGWAINFPHFIRFRFSNVGVSVLTSGSLSTDFISLALPDEATSFLTGGVNSVVFVIKENMNSFPGK